MTMNGFTALLFRLRRTHPERHFSIDINAEGARATARQRHGNVILIVKTIFSIATVSEALHQANEAMNDMIREVNSEGGDDK